MEQISIHSIEHIEQKIIAIETQYAQYYELTPHTHRRAQLLYGAEGLIHVKTPQGTWIIPPERAVWIPAEIPHSLTLFRVKTCSLYILPNYAPRQVTHCEVLSISPLLRELLIKAPKLQEPFSYHDNLIFELILNELKVCTKIDTCIPLPENPAMSLICKEFIECPNIHFSPIDFAAKLYLSERHFSRIFKEETGLSFSKWRQHVCILFSLEKIMKNQTVQKIAYELGFKNPTAFNAMFRRTLGLSPTAYKKLIKK